MSSISIIMNCYNGEKYLREAIDSIYAQTYQDWEIIFWDNCSSDQSAQIALSYTDGRLKYFRANVNAPLSTARNLAVKKVVGNWIAFLDVDDLWYPQKLERQLAAMEGSEYALCYAGIREINPDGNIIREVLPAYASGWMVEHQLQHYDINMVTPFLRRSFLDQFQMNFEEGLTCYADQNLFVRMAAKAPVCAIPEILGVWRISPGSLSDQTQKNWANERRFNLDQLKKENPGIEEKYPAAFSEAYARGDYYEARYLMTERRFIEARSILKRLSSVGNIYFALWIISHFPTIWEMAHSGVVKRKLNKVLFSLAGR